VVSSVRPLELIPSRNRVGQSIGDECVRGARDTTAVQRLVVSAGG
jgi:hypothetical protein